MSTPETEPELRLQDEVKNFYMRYGTLQATTGDTRRERFEQPLEMFEIRWLDRINDLEVAELRGCRTAANQHVDRLETLAKGISNAKDFEAVKGEAEPALRQIWKSVTRSNEPGSLSEKARQEEADLLYKQASELIHTRYAALREKLLSNVQDMNQGKEPSLAKQIKDIALEQELSADRELQRGL